MKHKPTMYALLRLHAELEGKLTGNGEVPPIDGGPEHKISQSKRSMTHAGNDLDPSVFVNQLDKPVQR